METKIVDVVTFIKPSREEAVLLADAIGGGEIHALHIMEGFMPAGRPVGYLVQPLPKDTGHDVVAAEREKVAQWMISHGYATGHGDTTEDLLTELEWQIEEEKDKG